MFLTQEENELKDGLNDKALSDEEESKEEELELEKGITYGFLMNKSNAFL